jgi:uncharacterized membrane protein
VDDQPGRNRRNALAWPLAAVPLVVGAVLMWGYELFDQVASNRVVVVSGFVCAVAAIVVVMFLPTVQPTPDPDGSDLDESDPDDSDLDDSDPDDSDPDDSETDDSDDLDPDDLDSDDLDLDDPDLDDPDLDDPDLDDPDLLRPATLTWRRRTATEMLVSGVFGIYAAFVLSIDAWLLAKNPDQEFSCDISAVISCGEVARTWQANLLSFPNAFLGILFESVVLTVSTALVAGVVFPRWFMRCVQALYTVALLFAVWLFTQSYFVIHVLCPWCLLITFTTILVWAGLTRINIRDGHLPTSPGVRRFVVTATYWYLTVAVCAVIVAMILGRYGASLFVD